MASSLIRAESQISICDSVSGSFGGDSVLELSEFRGGEVVAESALIPAGAGRKPPACISAMLSLKARTT